MKTEFLLLSYLIVFIPNADSELKLSLVNNGYEGLVIAIHPDIPPPTDSERKFLIENIQEIFTKASKSLYIATKHRAYLRKITILVPKNWPSQPSYLRAGLETFSTAHVRVHKPQNSVKQNTPHVSQTGFCGDQHKGSFMKLTTKFVESKSVQQQIGDVGKVLVHEWGHLRWGLLDEYAAGEYNKTSRIFVDSTTGEAEIVRCSKNIKARLINSKNETCRIDEAGCRYDLQYSSGNTATASMMFIPGYIPSITGFCDNDTNDPDTLHYKEAPNNHNKKCDHRSAWEVMREHPDFRNGVNPPGAPDRDTTPEFRLVQQTELRAVLVLDVSGSMQENDNSRKLQSAAKRFIQLIPKDSFVGLVTFADQSEILYNLTKVTDMTRDGLTEAVPNLAFGATSIGRGLETGLQVLTNHGQQSPDGGLLVVVSDGMENKYPYIKDVQDSLIQANITVEAILFTGEGDRTLLNLSRNLGGEGYLYTGFQNSTTLDGDLKEIISKRSSVNDTGVQITSAIYSFSYYSPFTSSFFIDDDVGRETTISFTWQYGTSEDFEFIVRDPNGTIPSDIVIHRLEQVALVKIPGIAQSGRWTFTTRSRSSTNTTMVVQVESKPDPASQNRPIELEGYITSESMSFEKAVKTPPRLFATLTQSYAPIVNAIVTAVVESTTGMRYIISLKDSGTGADVTAEDGIYSAFFTQFSSEFSNGLRPFRVVIDYSVAIEAENLQESARVKLGGYGEVIVSNSTGYRSTAEAVYSSIGPFTRTTIAGFITIEETPISIQHNNSDVLPPSKIRDLTVVKTSYYNMSTTITMEFTAVGDDFDIGNASWYDLRVGTSFEQVLKSFSTAVPINDRQLLAGDLRSPQPTNTLETLTILLMNTAPNITWFFGIRAVDDSGNIGDLSNVVTTRFIHPKNIPNIPDLTTKSIHSTTFAKISTLPTTESIQRTTLPGMPKVNVEQDTPPYIEVLIGLGVGISVMCILAVSVYLYCKGRKKQYNFAV